MFTLLHSSINQVLLEKYTSVIKVATMKNTNGTAHPSYHLKLKQWHNQYLGLDLGINKFN